MTELARPRPAASGLFPVSAFDPVHVGMHELGADVYGGLQRPSGDGHRR